MGIVSARGEEHSLGLAVERMKNMPEITQEMTAEFAKTYAANDKHQVVAHSVIKDGITASGENIASHVEMLRSFPLTLLPVLLPIKNNLAGAGCLQRWIRSVTKC